MFYPGKRCELFRSGVRGYAGCNPRPARPRVRPAAVDAASALHEGKLAQEHGDLKTAIADFRRALTLKPDPIEARANLGAALAAAGQLDAAIQEDSHVLELVSAERCGPDEPGDGLLPDRQFEPGSCRIRELHAAHPSDLNTAILLGYTYNKLNAFERKRSRCWLLWSRAMKTISIFEYVYAYALIRSGKQDAGLPRMEKLAKAKNSAEAWLLAGSARFYRGEMRDCAARIWMPRLN